MNVLSNKMIKKITLALMAILCVLVAVSLFLPYQKEASGSPTREEFNPVSLITNSVRSVRQLIKRVFNTDSEKTEPTTVQK